MLANNQFVYIKFADTGVAMSENFMLANNQSVYIKFADTGVAMSIYGFATATFFWYRQYRALSLQHLSTQPSKPRMAAQYQRFDLVRRTNRLFRHP